MTPPPAISFQGDYLIEQVRLFSNVSLTIQAGQWTCLLGKSGIGKSTILRLILGLETAGRFEGSVTSDDGRPVADRASYMAQSDLLLPWLSLRENVALGARLRAEAPDLKKADQMIAWVGLTEHASKTPNALSGGMRQRAALARTLMEDRSIVLLDEPFSALDAGTRADMQDLAAEVLQGKTVLLVTHDPAEACRLGHTVFLLSPDGSTNWPTPDTPPIRAIDDPLMLRSQAALLAHLRTTR